jgi:hypothetical protein
MWLLQNNTEIHLIYYDPVKDGYFGIYHYKKIKNSTSWSFIERRVLSTTSIHIAGCDWESNNIIIACYYQRDATYNFYRIRFAGLSETSYGLFYSPSYCPVASSASNITNNVFTLAQACGHNITGALWGVAETSQYPSTSLNSKCTSNNSQDIFSGNAKSIEPSRKKDFVYFYDNGTMFYVFDTSDTLGVPCTADVYSLYPYNIMYSCNELLPYQTTTYLPTGEISDYRCTYYDMLSDNLGNMHVLFFVPTNTLARMFQSESETKWYYHNISSVNTNSYSWTLGLLGTGSIFAKTESNNLYIYDENTTGYYYSPSSYRYCTLESSYILISDWTSERCEQPTESLNNIMCSSCAWLAGTTYEGGCLLATLFILAIVLSVIGWLFKYMEKEYKIQEPPNKYLISAIVSLVMIVVFVVIGMADLITAIISFFVIIAFLTVYEEGVAKK